MAILGLAIYMRMDPKANHFVKAAYDDKHESLYYIICYILIGVGGIMTFIGFLGCCGAFQESKCMLGTFFALIFLILAAECVGGEWIFLFKDKIYGSVTATFSQFVRTEYGRSVDVEMSVADYMRDEPVDYVQRTMKCCGAEGPVDWHGSSWEISDVHHLSRVPDSCCRDVSGVSGSWIDNTHPGVWNEGCGSKLQEFFKENVLKVLVVTLIIVGVEFLSMIFSIALCCGLRRESSGGYKS